MDSEPVEHPAPKRRRRSSQPPPKRSSALIAFMCEEERGAPAPAAAAGAGAGCTLPANEIIRLLNSDSHAPEAERSAVAPIPARAHEQIAAAERRAAVEAGPRVPRTLLLNESDDDEYDGAKALSSHLLSMTRENVVTLMLGRTDVRVWPDRTEVWCHHCIHPFTTVPIMAPHRMDRRTGRFLECTGNYCSFNCAKRAVLDSGAHDKWERCQLLPSLYRRVTGLAPPRIMPAPPRMALRQLGGVMNIEEFRQGFCVLPPVEGVAGGAAACVTALSRKCWPSFAQLHVCRGGEDRARLHPARSDAGRKPRFEATERQPTSFVRNLNMNVTYGQK